MFLRNCWYVAAWNHEVAPGGLLARTLLDEPVVLFRDRAGRPVALEDRCVHRNLPLSCGKVIGDTVQCGYHGLVFDRSGTVVQVPGQTAVPPGAAIRSYPVVERHRWVWIWMGDPAKADPAAIPDYHWNDDPEWVSVGDRFYVKGGYNLIVDNLLDLSHVQYVHATTLGSDAVVEFPVQVARHDDRIRIDRWILDRPPPPMFAKAGGYNGNVDRWQLITYRPPSHVVIDVGCATAGTGAPEGDRSHGIEMYSNHTITPETATTSHYFWHHARNFRRDDESLTEFLRKAAGGAFFEDVGIIEAQQASIDRDREKRPRIDINADAGVLAAQRLLARMVEGEARR